MKKLILTLALITAFALPASAGLRPGVFSIGLAERWNHTTEFNFVRQPQMVTYARLSIPAQGLRLNATVERIAVEKPDVTVQVGVEFGF